MSRYLQKWYCAQATYRKGGLVQHRVIAHCAPSFDKLVQSFSLVQLINFVTV